MNTFVKKFIENTSSLINREMWPAFFYEWYRECAKVWPPEEEETELFYILKMAGVSVDWNARKAVIIEATKQNIEKVLNNLESWSGDNIPITYLEGELTTSLSYPVYDIHEFIHEAANSLNLKSNSDNTAYLIPGR